METCLRWTFANGRTANAILVDASTDVSLALGQIGLYPPRPTIALVGGADGLGTLEQHKLEPLFVDALVPQAESLGAVIVDGGTDTGIMRLVGQAYIQKGATFPLIGVLPGGKVALSNESPLQATQLEPHHTHFVLVPGTQWGDESSWLAQITGILAGGLPSVTVLANGGDIAWQDVSASILHGRPVLVIAHSGRTADTLVAALHGETSDPQARHLATSGLLHIVNLADGAEAMAQALRKALTSSYSI